MKQALILVTSDSNYASTNGLVPRKFEAPKVYCDAVAAAGGVPVIAGEYGAAVLAAHCDALLLSGGNDMHPSYFGEEILNQTVRLDPPRDTFEWELMRLFLNNGKPILAICRGFQVLNVALGGTLYQDLPEQLGVRHMDSTLRHPVRAAADSFFGRTFGERFLVNSTHHQAVKDAGAGLRVTVRAEDGVIEAYEHVDRPIIGTQFHPERLTGERYDGTTQDFAPLFAHFLSMVRANA